MGLAVVWMYNGPGGDDPFVKKVDQPRRAHARSPAREQQPRRQEDDAEGPAQARRRPRDTRRRHLQLPLRRQRPHRPQAGRHRRRRDSRSRSTTSTPTAKRSGTPSPRARRRAPGRPASRTRSPTATSRSTPASSATPGAPTVGTETWSTPADLARRHLHLLLPRPPLHARRLPRRLRGLTPPHARTGVSSTRITLLADASSQRDGAG